MGDSAILTEKATKIRLNKREVAKILREVLSRAFEKELQTAAAPHIKRAIQQGIKFGVSQLIDIMPTPGEGAEWYEAEARKQLGAIVDQQITRLSKEVGRYTRIRLRNILSEGIESGETISQLTDRVQEWAGKRGDVARGTRARARMIARTETSRAVIEGQIESYEKSDVVSKKGWLLAPHSCEFCKAIVKKSKELGIRERFADKGSILKGVEGGTMKLDYENVEGPPLHPNCRCALIPVLEY